MFFFANFLQVLYILHAVHLGHIFILMSFTLVAQRVYIFRVSTFLHPHNFSARDFFFILKRNGALLFETRAKRKPTFIIVVARKISYIFSNPCIARQGGGREHTSTLSYMYIRM